MSTLHLVDNPDEWDTIVALSSSRPCAARRRFDGDAVDAVCGLTVHDSRRGHEDTTGTRRWWIDGRGDAHIQVKPGSAPLRAEGASRDEA